MENRKGDHWETAQGTNVKLYGGPVGYLKGDQWKTAKGTNGNRNGVQW